MQDFDINLAPGTVRVIDCQADYIYYRAGSAGGADAAIEFASRSGGETVFLYPGQAYRIPARLSGLGSSWSMKNRKGEATIIGSVILGEGEFQDNRISGSVEVIDGGKNRTLANQAFMGAKYVPGVAGNTPEAQLWNPPGSGKRLIVERITRTCANGGGVGVFWSNQQGATFAGNPLSKLAGGAASVAQLRTTSTVGNQTAPYLFNDVLLAGVAVSFQLIEPIIVPPGWGLTVGNTVIAGDVIGGFEYFEETI